MKRDEPTQLRVANKGVPSGIADPNKNASAIILVVFRVSGMSGVDPRYLSVSWRVSLQGGVSTSCKWGFGAPINVAIFF